MMQSKLDSERAYRADYFDDAIKAHTSIGAYIKDIQAKGKELGIQLNSLRDFEMHAEVYSRSKKSEFMNDEEVLNYMCFKLSKYIYRAVRETMETI